MYELAALGCRDCLHAKGRTITLMTINSTRDNDVCLMEVARMPTLFRELLRREE